jgi:hypothetical protein
VDRQVGTSLEQGLFDLLDEHPFPADLRQWGVQESISTGGDFDQRSFQAGVKPRQQIFDVAGLPEGKRALSSSDSKPLHLFEPREAIAA